MHFETKSPQSPLTFEFDPDLATADEAARNETESLLQTVVCKRKALRERMREAGDADREDLVDQLPGLEAGECYIWSPGWLRSFQRTRIRKRKTYDASATPKLGAKPREVQKLAPVDLELLRTQMADVVERAEQDDPKALRRKIAALERELRQARSTTAAPSPEQLEAARDQGAAAERRGAAQHLAALEEKLREVVAQTSARLGAIARLVEPVEPVPGKVLELAREPITYEPPERPALPDRPSPAPAASVPREVAGAPCGTCACAPTGARDAATADLLPPCWLQSGPACGEAVLKRARVTPISGGRAGSPPDTSRSPRNSGS